MAYRLEHLLNQGATSAAWAAVTEGPITRRIAIKFVLKSDYARHSLYTEAARVQNLDATLFAHLAFYGEPEFDSQVADAELFLAVVVDWVEGHTLKHFTRNRRMLSGDEFLGFARDLCAVLKQLNSQKLVHNDLHAENVMICEVTDPMTLAKKLRIKVIDTGTLKSEDRRQQQLESWTTTVDALRRTKKPELASDIALYDRHIRGFSVSDQEWVVCHLVALFNLLRRASGTGDPRTRRFVRLVPAILTRMIDRKAGGSMTSPQQMIDSIEKLWHTSLRQQPQTLTTPFDLPYAELIRSDRQLMELFSDQYPGLDECRSHSPTYLYGPRGCGKSTVLRSLSLKAVLQSRSPTEELKNVPFFGVYVCCSSELRTRFLFLKEVDYDALESSIVRYFTLLLVEELVGTLEFARSWDAREVIDFAFSESVVDECVKVIRDRLALPATTTRYISESSLVTLQHDLQISRDELWRQIVNRETLSIGTDAQAIFDVSQRISEICQFLTERRLVFLLDDYSSQRIPPTLQRKLNVAITFSKKACPLFKVTSEYGGVDLTGLTEGREVREVNVGSEYVSLQGKRRYQFLTTVLNKRFQIAREALPGRNLGCDVATDITDVLGLSKIKPAVEMAREIRDKGNGFYYHGIDTIADLCSGDFATGLDLVQRVFDRAKMDWTDPSPIGPKIQHDAIQDFAMHEFDRVLAEAPLGKRKYEIVERLAWLSHSYAAEKETESGEPVVKTHLDIDDVVLESLKTIDVGLWVLFHELIRDGLLFPLQTSRSASNKRRTLRFMVRRILLAQHRAPLGRHTAIKFHEPQRLVSLLREPADWAQLELGRLDESFSSPDRDQEDGPQKRFDFRE